jgi:deoxyribodipyrimidine photo-lyase
MQLQQAGVTLGETYPEPIVDHKQARERALAALSEVTGG